MAFTFSEKDQNVRLFVQGQLVKQFEMTGSGPLRSTKNSLYIGLRLVNDFITGQISDVRIWKKVCSMRFYDRVITGERRFRLMSYCMRSLRPPTSAKHRI